MACETYSECNNSSLSNEDLFKKLIQSDSTGCATLKVKKINSFSSEAQAYFAQLQTQPNARVKNAYNNLWKNYQVVQSLHDLEYQNIAEFEDNKRTSLVNPDSFYQSKISTPTTIPFNGSRGGTGMAYDSGFIPSIHAVNYKLNDACFWVYNGSSNTGTSRVMIGCSVAGEAGMINASFNVANPSFQGGINTYNEINGGMFSDFKNFYGLWSVQFNGSLITVYHNGVSVYTLAKTPEALPNFSFYELAFNLAGVLTSPYTGKIYGCGICKGTVNQTDLYEMNKNYIGDLPMWKYYGDSIFAGYNLSDPPTQSIPYLLSAGKSQGAFNNGISGTTVADFINSGVKIERTNNTDGRVLFDWFINDAVAVAGILDFKANYRLAIQMAIDGGCPASRITIIKNWHITDAVILALISPYVIAVQEVADEYGIITQDLSAVAYGLQGDGLHPTEAGCVTAANYLISQL